MKNLLNNLLNWVLKKGPSETKKDQAWEEKEQAGSKKEQAEQKGNKLGEKGTSLEMNPCVRGSEAREVMGSEAREVMGSEAMSANHALITQLPRNNHPISLRAIRYAAVLFMVFMVGIGNVWGAETALFNSFSSTTKGDYFKNYTVDSKTVTVATDLSISSSSGDYFVSLGSTPSNNASNYIELSVTSATIKTVSVLITGNGSDKTCQPALLGWTGAIADNATADYVLVPSSRSISNKGLSNAEWHQFDVHGNDLTKVRIYRAVKGVDVAGESTSKTTFGNAQSLQFYGIRVELEVDGVTNPSFSPATGSSLVKSAGTVTLTSSGNTVYYKWSQTNNQYASGDGATLAGAADGSGTSPVNATAPSTTGTWYLYAVAKNGGDYSNVVKATYTITNPTHTLTWALDGGTATGGTAAGAVAEGATLTAPTVTKVGYDFAGWSPSVPATMPAADATYTATWTKVYASGTYTFYGNTTVGSSPSKTVTTTATDYDAFRIDNLFFSSTNIQYESGSGSTESNDYYGWKVKKSSTIKFFVEDDSDVKICIGTIGGGTCTVSYTDHSSVAHNNTSISSGSHETYEVKGGTMVTLSMAPSSSKSVTLKQIMITPSVSCTAPNHVDISGTWHIFPGDDLEMTARAYSTAGTSNEITEGLTYQWQKYTGSSFTDIAGATSATYTKTDAGVSDAGQYRCLVSTGGSIGDACTTASAADAASAFKVKSLELLVYYNDNSFKYRIGFSKVDDTHATASVLLENSSYKYTYKITDSQGKYWGNNGASGMTSSNCTNWSLTQNNDYYTGLTTTKAATYIFNLTYNAGLDAFSMSVVYPEGDQTADRNLYFANDGRQWNADKIYYRIGHGSYNNHYKMSKVYGTANLFQVTTPSWGGFAAWHIANNACNDGGTSVYNTKDGDNPATEAVRFEGAAVPSSGLTVIPDGSNHWAGTGDAYGCEFYGYSTVSGMWTHTATISATTNGSIRLNWRDINNAAQSATSTTSGLAHTCNLQITGVPDAGYDVATLTVNGSNFTSGNTHVLSADATIAATFSLHNYNVTYSAPSNGSYTIKVADGSASSESKTATMGQTITLAASASTGYHFTGWTITNTDNSTDITNSVSLSAQTENATFTMPAANVSITATFAINTYTVSFAASPAGYGSVSPTSIASVNHGSTVSIASNVLTLKATNVTATPTDAGSDYTYAFSSWSVSNGASITEAQTITANFTRTAKQYSVTHSLTGVTTSSGATGANAATYGTNYTAEFAASSGYTLPATISVTIGGAATTHYTWNSSTGTVVVDGAYITGNIVITVTGESAAATYTVTYQYNGATGGSGTASETASSVTLPTPTKTDYTFQGWYESSGTKAGNGGATYNPAADITLYALWRADCDGGGGSGGTLFSQNFNSATAVTLASTTNKASHLDGESSNNVFGSTAASQFTSLYAAQKSSAGYAINNGDYSGQFGVYANNTGYKYCLAKTTNFAATPPTALKIVMKMTLKGLNGTNSAAVLGFAVGSGFSDSKSMEGQKSDSIHSGFSFDNHTTNHVITSYNTTTSISSTNKISDNTEVTLTWIINNTGADLTYTDPASGSTTIGNDKFDVWVGSTKYVAGQAALNGAKPLRQLIIGDPAGKKHEFKLNDITVTDLTPAVGSCYYVTYNGNGADGGFTKDETAYASGTDVTVLSNSFTKTGYTFTGWYTKATNDGTGTAYAAGDKIEDISANVTLYAQWTAGTKYSVTYNGNSATSGTAPTDASSPYASGANVTVLGNTGSLEKTNYTFDGWATANDGTGTSYAVDGTISSIAADMTLYAKWKQTVTLNTGLQGEGADKTPTVYWNGASLSGFSAHSVAGYELQGYYTASSGGTKVLNANGSFAASAVTNYITDSKWSRTNTTTLYAQWRAASGSTCYTWDATETKPRTGTNENFGGLYLTASSKTKVSFYKDQAADSCYNVSKASQVLTGNLNGTEIGSVKFKASSSDATNNTFIIAFCDQTTFSTDHIIQVGGYDCTVKDVNKNDAAASEYTVTAPAGTKSFALGRNLGSGITASATLENSGNRYLYYIQACSKGGGTHTITYNNGGGSGTMSSHSSIADNGSQTLTSNTFTAPTNYTFAGWVADKDVTIGGDTKRAGTLIADGATITNITTDINLTAKWSLPLTLTTGLQGSGDDEELAVYYNSTSITGHTPHTAGGYRLLGYYTADEDGTKVLNADGTFAATAVTGYIADGKWTYTTASSLTLHGQWETSSLLKWNLQTNKSETSISTTSKESATVRISTENMTNLSNPGSLTITGSAKSGLTSKIATTAGTTGTDAGKYMSVQFQIANGYKLVPTAINVKAQPISHAQTVKLILEDNHSQSINHTSSSISKGSTQTVTMTNDGGTEFTGTVTLKIYCYGTAESDGYRLGSPIEINGSIEEACTMPSYTGLDYEQTEYMKGADASAITVTDPTDVTTYLWKQNTSNDRSGGSAATGTNNTASYTPSTSANGTTYYWCELTNACGTVKTPAVAISVRTDKTDPTVTWTNPAVTVNYGGGNYTLRATVNETAWDGTLTASMLTTPSGINIHDVTIGTDGSSKQYIEVNFDVQTSFDRATYATAIPFTLSLPETTNYDAVDDEHDVTYSACSGAGAGSSYDIKVRKDVTKVDNNYYCWLSTDGWISPSPNNSISTSSIKKADSSMGDSNQFDTIYDNNSQTIYVRTYHANINKVRIYAKFNANDMTVTNVYKHSTYFSPGSSNEIDADEYTVVYNDDENADDLGTAAQGYVDITLNTALAANDIICVKFNTSRVRPLGAIITEASGGSVSTTLTFASAGPIAKTVGDAAFSNVASTTSKSLGAITYSSSNTGVATVNATTGAVTIVGAGSTTITATLAASGCFQRTTTTYTLNVSAASCADVAGTVTTRDLGCDGIELTVSGYTDGASVQWYKDEVSMGASYRNATCTVTVAGEYYAVTHKDCDKASNTVTIAAKTVTATKLVDSWYVKNGRLTPDIALVQTTGAESFTVTSGGSPITDIGGCEFYLGEDGIIYLKGAQEDGTAPSGMTVGDETITITASVCSTDATPLDIVIHRQVQTDKHVLAFVVTGTAKGGFTDGISADQTTNVPLYNTLTENFDVLATNIYSTDDEKKLKEYYSQFDILCVTDYPNTGTKGVNKKSYVDALGSLIDIRPILTMEAFVAKLSNWKAKGISGTPESPSERQYTMLLQCKDHEIFAGTTLTKIGEGDETMYRVTMVDNTMEEYVSLDVNTPGTKAYDAGGKPALQGFTFSSEMLEDGLLPLGLIDDGAGNDLQVGIERQAQMEARLMVLGINGYAMERLTDDGMQIIVNALKYLMKKNTEDIADCSTSFIGGDGDEPESTRYDWHDAAHWTGNALPQVSQKVRILTKCIIRSGKETPHVAGVIIAPRGKYNHGSNEAAGSLTIEPGAALIVEGKVEAATAPAYNKPYATTSNLLTIQTNSSNQAALIFDNEEAETQATVNLYSLGRRPSSYQYQYFAVPMEVVPVNPTFANETHGGTGIYTYVYEEASSGWTRRKYYDDLFAFEGLGITTKSTGAMNYTMTGNLASTATKEITLTHDGAGLNLVGNSWMAPIQIGALAEDNAGLDNQTAYIYCAGRDAVEGAATSGDTETAGQWIAIPFEAAAFATWKAAGKLSVIPAMQAFQIKVDAEATLTLDYDKVVRGSTNDLNAKLRAPGRRMAANEVTMTNIRVADSKTHTDLSLFEGDRFSEAFDNGWEAEYMNGDGRSAKLYAETEAGQMAVVAMYDYEGTVVGFAPGQETEYTFSFMGEDNGYYLNDIKLQNSVRISEGETYTFTYEEGDAANRFYISRTAINAPEVATGMENLDAAAPRVQKIIYNDKLYIIRGGRLYDATGKVVK